MLIFISLALLISLSSAGNIKFIDCGSHEVKNVSVSQCEGDLCVIHKGKDLTINIEFTANQNTKAVEIQLLAKIGELEAQVPGIDTDGCNGNENTTNLDSNIEHFNVHLGHLTCPLVKGQNYTLKYSLFIPKLVPTVKAQVTAKLIGDNGVLGCGKVNGSIED